MILQVMINILCFSGKLLQNMLIFRFRHLPGHTAMSVAKGAFHIANIGDLHIDPAVHTLHLLMFCLL